MTTGDALLLDIEAQMQDIGLPLMARKLDQIYRSPDYLTHDKLSLISGISLLLNTRTKRPRGLITG